MNRGELAKFILSLKGIEQPIKKKLIATFLINEDTEKVLTDLDSYKGYKEDNA